MPSISAYQCFTTQSGWRREVEINRLLKYSNASQFIYYQWRFISLQLIVMHKVSSRWQQFTNRVLRAARLRRQSRGSDSSELIRFYSLNRRWPTSPQVKIEQHNQNFKAQTRKQAFRKQNWCKPKSWKISVRFSRKRKWLFDLQAILQETSKHIEMLADWRTQAIATHLTTAQKQ